MKKILLLAAAALMVTSANAQLKRSEVANVPARPQLVKAEMKKEVAQMRTPGTPVVKAPKKAATVDVWYDRPAGAFPGFVVVEEGASGGLFYAPYLLMKPFVNYTFKGHAIGMKDDATIEWDVQYYNDETGEDVWYTDTECGMNFTWKWGLEIEDAPVINIFQDGALSYYQLHGWEMGGTPQAPQAVSKHAATIFSVPSVSMVWDDTDILVSSKTFSLGGRNGDQYYPMSYYSGAQPYDPTEEEGSGYWFGKNGGTASGYRLDGIAQAFEKPTAPYKLNQVVVDAAVLEVAEGAQVDMTCKIYKLDGIPAYNDTAEAVLPDEPGELIAMGRATVTPETDATTGGLIFFTLYGEEDGLEYDITPTIDFPILVVVDGYNDPEQEDLLNFSALISSDDEVDEGFGELAYLKFGIPDEDGNLDHYVYAGLNNFFTSGAMKTGFTIFLSIENPYLKFYFDEEENGEYTFPDEGGKFMKTFDGEDYDFIVFESYEASADDNWYVTCNDDEVPSWLNITLEDYMNEAGEFTGIVFANVTAEPLPEGMKGRKAVVRFEYDGAYIDYTFIQGDPEPAPLEGDVNHDGSVNITDVNLIIDMILSGTFNADGDINHDGNVNISDINAEIAIILK